jgi:sigma-B regulation protein RsbU (phosphoserine phosphatase)
MLQETTQDLLCTRIAMLQKATHALTRALTLKDFGVQFAGVVQEMFSPVDVHVLFRPEGSVWWQPLISGNAEGGGGPLPPVTDEPTPECVVRELPSGVAVSQRLSDGAAFRFYCIRDSAVAGDADLDVVTLRLLAYFFDTSYHELQTRKKRKELVFSLNHRLLQLNSLIDTGIEVTKLEARESPQRLALERAAALTNASAGRVRVMRGDLLREEVCFPEGANVAPGGGVTKSRIEAEFVFGEETYQFELHNKESRDGVEQFDATDHLLLDALVRQVHASLENRYLHTQALEKQRLEQDLLVAASIQEKILPAKLPDIPSYDIAGINIPSKSVGGDYYDCIPLVDGRCALIMADVAGKGIPAALLVSSLHAYLRAYLESGIPLVDLVRRLNQVIYTASTDDKFITAFVGILTPETGTIESVSAGHNPVYCMRADGTVQELNAGGIALGMLEMDFPYQSEITVIDKGEGVLLYTDGIPEAADATMQLYESHVPLKEFLLQHRHLSARQFIAGLIHDIRSFTGNAPQNDDITALYVVRSR